MPIVTPEVGRTGLMYSASWKAKTDVCRVMPPSQVFEQVSLTAAEESGNSSCRVILRTPFSFLTRRLLLMYV
jgi:hypothetical protein